MSDPKVALVVGAGPGLGASLGRRFAKAGLKVALAARTPSKLDAIVSSIGGGASAHGCDATDETAVKALFEEVEQKHGPVDIAVFNASGRVRKSVLDMEVGEFETAWRGACLGGFVVGREAGRRMVPRGSGTILFTGATASVKAYAMSAGFAVGKFGLRALAYSMARDLGPKGVHVAHVIVDGGISGPRHSPKEGAPEDHHLDPDAIAETYWHLATQHRSAWSVEVDVRPWVETF